MDKRDEGAQPRTPAEMEEGFLDLMELWIKMLEADRDMKEELDFVSRFDALLMLRTPEAWPRYVEESDQNPGVWDTLQYLVRELLELGWTDQVAKCEPLFKWVLEAAAGVRSRRGKRKGSFKKERRDPVICLTVAAIAGSGPRPPTSNKDGWSACHRVANRLGRSYEAVRTIWQARERRGFAKQLEVLLETYANCPIPPGGQPPSWTRPPR